MEILIGCDPEFFVRKNGELISAHGLIPGDKHNPHIVEKGAVQVDGMALEFNINPVSNLKDWRGNIKAVIGQLRSMLGEEYEFDFSPVAHFGKEYIDQQPEVAKTLGCDPDYNAYTGSVNPKPNENLPFRTASGHIHVGWTKDMDPFDPEHFEACKMLTKQLDLMLAVPSLLWDGDKTRREMYGQLGSFRPKSYGMEYRVLSNAWLNHKETISAVFNITTLAVNDLLSGKQWYTRKNAEAVFRSIYPADWYNILTRYYPMYGQKDKNDRWFFYNLYTNLDAQRRGKATKKSLWQADYRDWLAVPGIVAEVGNGAL